VLKISFVALVLFLGDSSHLQPLTANLSVRKLGDASSLRLIIRPLPQGSSNKSGTPNPVPQAAHSVRKENISRSSRALSSVPTDVSRHVESLPPGQTTSRVANTVPPPANLSSRGNDLPPMQANSSRRGDIFLPTNPQRKASVSRRAEPIPPATMGLSKTDSSLLTNNGVGRPRKRTFGTISDSPVAATCPSVSQRNAEISVPVPSDSPNLFRTSPSLPSNSLTDDRQCSSRPATLVDHGANALALVTAPAAMLPWQSTSSGKPKENEATALKKKLMNIASLHFQTGLQRIILSLGQLVSCRFLALGFLIRL